MFANFDLTGVLFPLNADVRTGEKKSMDILILRYFFFHSKKSNGKLPI